MLKTFNVIIYIFLSIFFTILPIVQTPYFQSHFFQDMHNKIAFGILLLAIYIFLGLFIRKIMLVSRLKFSYANTYTERKNLINEKYMFYISLTFMIIVIFVMQALFSTLENQIVSFVLMVSVIAVSHRYSKRFSKNEKLTMIKTLPPLVYYQFRILLFLGESIDKIFSKKSNKNEEAQ